MLDSSPAFEYSSLSLYQIKTSCFSGEILSLDLVPYLDVFLLNLGRGGGGGGEEKGSKRRRIC